MTLCGGKDGGEDTCSGKHKDKTLKCDHQGCNYHEGDCKSCDSESKESGDNDAIETKSMTEKSSSDSFKQHLQEFLKDPTNKKHNPEEGRVGELESS